MQILGVGTSSIVYKNKKGEAVKVFKENIYENGLSCFIGEIDITRRLVHPNILNTTKFYIKNDKFRMVMQAADSTLSQILPKIEESKKATYAFGLLNALNFLHKNNVLHLDIKSDNIFYFKDKDVFKLGDFGLSKTMDNGKAYSFYDRITDVYKPPEIIKKITRKKVSATSVIRNKKIHDKKEKRFVFTYAQDVWCMGLTLLEMFSGKHILDLNLRYLRMTIGKKVKNHEFVKILTLMLDENPELRPTVEELLSNDVFVQKEKTIKTSEERVVRKVIDKEESWIKELKQHIIDNFDADFLINILFELLSFVSRNEDVKNYKVSVLFLVIEICLRASKILNEFLFREDLMDTILYSAFLLAIEFTGDRKIVIPELDFIEIVCIQRMLLTQLEGKINFNYLFYTANSLQDLRRDYSLIHLDPYYYIEKIKEENNYTNKGCEMSIGEFLD